ncbi:aminoacyl-histidine dipeptidase [Acholeplasma equifetale]|uniref:aminoacyl-histidine dipeptidase n=1 Tax=Acholeplasma equifetale TaxID=264634 RepID=UPI00138AAD7C|nr:aminoacyl-histidine dipeptidase [Acholeplasma equifetale]
MANKVLDYFYQIMQIPRESGNEDGMVAFLESFAKINNLQYIKDEHKNILIKKNTSGSKPLILQAHTDMVCVKTPNAEIDFARDAIEPVIEGEFLKAKNSSLGADNGIGVAMILSLLEENIPLNVEALFTSEEETTMKGAKKFDISLFSGKHLLSLDSSMVYHR